MTQVKDALNALEGLTETARVDVMRPLEVLNPAFNAVYATLFSWKSRHAQARAVTGDQRV